MIATKEKKRKNEEMKNGGREKYLDKTKQKWQNKIKIQKKVL